MSPVVTNTMIVGFPRCMSDDTGRSSSGSNAYCTALSDDGIGAPFFVETPTGTPSGLWPHPARTPSKRQAIPRTAPVLGRPRITMLACGSIIAFLTHEMIALLGEKDVERREGAVATGDILLHLDL